MADLQDHLKDLTEIRSIMERSTKFISLSGLSGVSAGIVALFGAWITWQYLSDIGLMGELKNSAYMEVGVQPLFTLLGLAVLILIAASGAATFFSLRMARKRNLPTWNSTAKRLMISLLVPLSVGGAFCVLLAWHGYGAIVASATLVFYGLALLNASKYTFKEIRYLGLSEIVLGLIGGIFLKYGLIIWAIGFGVLHIFYGIVMYLKYER
jgi:hypothetical protein